MMGDRLSVFKKIFGIFWSFGNKTSIPTNPNAIVDDEYCPVCMSPLNFEYENNGFSAPDPEHWEASRVWCEVCGWEA